MTSVDAIEAAGRVIDRCREEHQRASAANGPLPNSAWWDLAVAAIRAELCPLLDALPSAAERARAYRTVLVVVLALLVGTWDAARRDESSEEWLRRNLDRLFEEDND